MKHFVKTSPTRWVTLATKLTTGLAIGITLGLATPSSAKAAPSRKFRRPASAPTTQTPKAQHMDIDAMKKRYWAGTNEDSSALKVIQNRMYSKSSKVNLLIQGGSFSGDPFLNQWSYGAGLGIHLSESLGVTALYTRFSNSFNGSHQTLIDTTSTVSPPGVGSDSNEPYSLVGGELSWSLFYGKLSLGGFAIIHFDMMVLGGAGQLLMRTGATTGITEYNTIAYWPGISAQTYLSTWLALKLDYKLMIYNQKVVGRNSADARFGQEKRNETALAPQFNIGLNIMF